MDAALYEMGMPSAPRWQVAAAPDGLEVVSAHTGDQKYVESVVEVVLSEAWIVGHSTV